jgi:hypothetical protein
MILQSSNMTRIGFRYDSTHVMVAYLVVAAGRNSTQHEGLHPSGQQDKFNRSYTA